MRVLLAEGSLDEIAHLVTRQNRALNALVSHTYDPDSIIAWRAVEAIGAAADRMSDDHPEIIRDLLRRLHWSLSEESGSFCLFAPPAMAEVVRRRPALFEDDAPIVVNLLRSMADEDLVHFLEPVLWAIGRLAPVAGAEVETVVPLVERCLEDPRSQVRGLAVWCLAQAGQKGPVASRVDLLSDDGPVELYTNGRLERTSVAALVRALV